jgi:hypothetical protein
MTTLLLVLWLVVISVNVYLDRNGAKRNYLQVNIIRAMAGIVHASLFGLDPKEVWLLVSIVTYQVTAYFIFFPLLLNIVTSKTPYLTYIDRIEGDSGWIDRYFAKRKPIVLVYWKLAALVGMTIALILIYAIH